MALTKSRPNPPSQRKRRRRKLSLKRRRFVAELAKDANQTRAAIRAGYSPKTAKQQGSRLLTNADVRDAVQTTVEKVLEDADVTAVEILRELRRLALSDVRTLFDAQGNLKPLHTLTDAQAAAIASFEVIIKSATGGDGVVGRVLKVKCWDKVKALELLAKHLHLIVDRVEHTGKNGGPLTIEAVRTMTDEELERRLLAYAQELLPAAVSG